MREAQPPGKTNTDWFAVQSDLLLPKEDLTTFGWAQRPSERISVPVDGFSLQSASAQQPRGHTGHPYSWKAVLGAKELSWMCRKHTVVSSPPRGGKELLWTRTNPLGRGQQLQTCPFPSGVFLRVILCLPGPLGPVLWLPREPQTPSMLPSPYLGTARAAVTSK